MQRLAYNYEHGNSLENRIAVVLNQGVRSLDFVPQSEVLMVF